MLGTAPRGISQLLVVACACVLIVSVRSARHHPQVANGLSKHGSTGRELLQSDQAPVCSVTIQMGDTLDNLSTACGASLAPLNPNITDVNNIRADYCICVPRTCSAIIDRPAPRQCIPGEISNPVVPPASPTDVVSAAEKAYAVLAAVLGPTLAVGAWLLITTSYRTEKRTIIAELGKRMTASDITDTSGAAGEVDEIPTEEMRKVAREIAKWCLWRWDGFLGFRAGSDSVGRRPGVWKDKFESVRCAVLLEAFSRLNHTHQKHFSTQSDAPGCLMSAWQASGTSQKKRCLVDWIAVVLQDITADEAEALPKDPEIPALHYRLASVLPCSKCCSCC